MKTILAIFLVGISAVLGWFFYFEYGEFGSVAKVNESIFTESSKSRFKALLAQKRFEQEKRDNAEGKKYTSGGAQFVKINVIELFDICDRHDEGLIGKSFVMRGIVYKNKELEADKEFALMRRTLWCCEDHSVSFGFRVVYNNSESLKNGEWVMVYGRLERKGQEQGSFAPADGEMKKINLSPNVDVEKKWVFVASKLEKTNLPKQPYISYWNKEEPFYF